MSIDRAPGRFEQASVQEANAMTRIHPDHPMRIEFSDERRAELLQSFRGFAADEFDLDLSEFQAERLLEHMLRRLGAPIYNQAIQDARRFMQEKLEDLEGEFYEPEGES